MCGLVGYVGKASDTGQVLLEALESLAYRGYDSAGLGLIEDTKLTCYRTLGHPVNLRNLFHPKLGKTSGAGVAHTRWATHGPVTLANAHPHATDQLAVVHNGIISNFRTLKHTLSCQGYRFISDTDSEVVTHLMTHNLMLHQEDPDAAFQATLQMLEGSFALCLILKNHPETLWGAAQGTAPLLIAQGSDEGMMVSDVAALPPRSRPWQGMALEDNTYAALTPHGLDIRHFNGKLQTYVSEAFPPLHSEATPVLKTYPHHTYTEMLQQPNLLREIIQNSPQLQGLQINQVLPRCPDHLTLIGCGSSYYAASTGAYAFETLAKIPTSLRYASEMMATLDVQTPNSHFLLLSQSGETADVVAVAQGLIQQGHSENLIGITNRPSSTLQRCLPRCLSIPTGIERGVAATKSFSAQVLTLLLMARHWSSPQEPHILEMSQGLDAMENVLNQPEGDLFPWLKTLLPHTNLLILGRNHLFPLACEGALKLKELAYIHAEALPAGEMKHGPLALLDISCPVMVLAPHDARWFNKIESNVREIAARQGKIFLITDSQGAESFNDLSLAGLTLVPFCHTLMMPFVYGAVLQRLAYAVALHRGCSIDYPRNLAKSVSVD